VSGPLDIANCRFIGNQATNGNGGALRLQESTATVVNTEFVGNTATTVGGAVWGRGTFVSSTFTNNTATNSGSALYAPAGADMYMHHCVAYPDTVVGQNIYAPYSCMKSNVLGSPKIALTSTPFAPADLDSDGRTEYYLLPGSQCVALDGGVIDQFEWDELTVDASQCTDSGWPDPGVHYTPQSAVGACP
jgi:predicted outer membrane repeat protein